MSLNSILSMKTTKCQMDVSGNAYNKLTTLTLNPHTFSKYICVAAYLPIIQSPFDIFLGNIANFTMVRKLPFVGVGFLTCFFNIIFTIQKNFLDHL